MKKLLTILILFFTIFHPTQAQKVGLVLSGGGAKGITHIGIIRALEENNIPIDYITGTSMGAIVGSMYAMGYTPDEMEKLLKSESFKRWYMGGIEEKYQYYFKKTPPSPEFLNIRVALKDPLHKVKTQFLPSSVVDPIQMNIVFMELFAQATASCRSDFNQLFVPFRCVASDTYNKKAIYFKDGDLGDAVRASMSFPAMFKPIEIDSLLVYDGGIYDNFPVGKMIEDFNPDIIIGSVVSSNPTKPREGDIMGQLENMIMQKTDYTIPDSLGILMTFNYKDVSLMDFNRFDEIHNNGYNRAIELMDSIKGRISRRVSLKQVDKRRIEYKNDLPKMVFNGIKITGANDMQQKYIRKAFHTDENHNFTLEDLRTGYFRLMSDKMVSEIIPHAIYDYEKQTFNLHLKVKMADDLALRVGGNVGSNGANQIYLGATYHNLAGYSKEFSLDTQLGQIYNNVQLSARFDLPTRIPTSYRMVASLSNMDYLKQEKLFSKGDGPIFNKTNEEYVKVMMSMPFLSRQKVEFSLGVARIKDQYFQTNVIDFAKSHHDQSKYTIFGGSIALDGNTLNSRQFATQGRRERLSAHIYTGKENFISGINDESHQNDYDYSQTWLQMEYELEMYHPLKKGFTLGTHLHSYYSSRNYSHNYRATMMQAGAFTPTPHSKINYNEAFRANQFMAAGIIPIYELNPVFHARLGLYGFLPIYPIQPDEHLRARQGKIFSHAEFMGDLALVVKLPFGTISTYVNYYSSPHSDWNVGLSLGWLIFGERFIH